MMLTNPSAATACAAAAGMYPWYRPTSAHGSSAMAHADSMSQLGQFCSNNGSSNGLPTIKTENGYGLSHHGLSSSGSSNGGKQTRLFKKSLLDNNYLSTISVSIYSNLQLLYRWRTPGIHNFTSGYFFSNCRRFMYVSHRLRSEQGKKSKGCQISLCI